MVRRGVISVGNEKCEGDETRIEGAAARERDGGTETLGLSRWPSGNGGGDGEPNGTAGLASCVATRRRRNL